MTDEMTGHVVAVVKEIRGDELAVALVGGETSLTVHDTADFDERGGSLRLGSTIHTYTAVNDTTNVISGISPALAAAAVDTRVDVWSVAHGDVAAEWIATVADDTDGAPVEMPVASTLVDLLKGGIRGLAGESVVCKRDGSGEWEVATQLGQATSTSTGMVLQTDDEGNRIVIQNTDTVGAEIRFYGDNDADQPGRIFSASAGLSIVPPLPAGGARPVIVMAGGATAADASVSVEAGHLLCPDQPRSHRARASTQSIPDNTWTAVNFTADMVHTGIDWGSSQWTIEVDGEYIVHGYVRFTGGGTAGRRGCRITWNGSRFAEMMVPPTATDTSLNIAFPIPEALVGDTIQIQVFQNSGSAQNIADDARGSIRLVG